MDKTNSAPEEQNIPRNAFDPNKENTRVRRWNIVPFLGMIVITIIGLGLFGISRTPVGSVLGASLNSLFALDSQQIMWYITRAAGITSYILLWFSSAWGLAISSKIIDSFLHRSFTYDFHEFISLLAIGFIFLHILVLLFDRFLPYNLAQILIPFTSPYRPLWVGIGVLGFYLTLLVTITFYIRSWIGVKAFRTIHVLSFAAYLGATLHGFFSGTDSSLLSVQIMYAGTFLIMVFLTTYWLVIVRNKKSQSQPVAPASHNKAIQTRHHPSRVR